MDTIRSLSALVQNDLSSGSTALPLEVYDAAHIHPNIVFTDKLMCEILPQWHSRLMTVLVTVFVLRPGIRTWIFAHQTC
jgi:hypothetical protein